MMDTKPFHAAEIAQRLGITVETFYKNRPRYLIVDRMPAPISNVGRPAYERASMEAWLTRNDPRRPKPAANDAIARPTPNTDAEWNQFLRQYRGQPAE